MMTTSCDTTRLIIGVDPGKMTGLAWLIDDTFKSTDLAVLNACTVMDMLLREYEGCPIIIAVERYSITQQTSRLTRQYDALEVIGVCRWFAHSHDAQFLLQSAAAAQRCGNRDVLRALGWWKPGGDHLNKAAAQVALAYQTTSPLEFTRRLEPGMIN